MDLDEPADVHYRQDLTSDVERGKETKPFETIIEAVRFVMETLAEPLRPSAYIVTPEKRLEQEDIRAIYESAEYKAFKG
jgi:hypothetical protein